MATPETITVSIFDKDYQVSCPPQEVQALRDSAFFLDQKMREIKQAGSVLGLDRLAVMAALNITHELLSSTEAQKTAETMLAEHSAQLSRGADRIDLLINALKSAKA